jgi:hypothetical protein
MLSIIPPEVVVIPSSQPESHILGSLPTAVGEAYAMRLEELPPAEVEQLTELVETMSLIAERLHVLVTSERGDSEEAVQIEQVLEAYYDELCTILGLPIDGQERARFIAAVRSNSFQNTVEAAFEAAEDDEGTHEHKRVITVPAHQLPVLLQQTANLARFIMQLGVSHSHGLQGIV